MCQNSHKQFVRYRVHKLFVYNHTWTQGWTHRRTAQEQNAFKDMTFADTARIAERMLSYTVLL